MDVQSHNKAEVKNKRAKGEKEKKKNKKEKKSRKHEAHPQSDTGKRRIRHQ